MNSPSCQHCGNNDPSKFIYEDKYYHGSVKSGCYMEKSDKYRETHLIKCCKCRKVVAKEIEYAYGIKWVRPSSHVITKGEDSFD